MKSLRVNSIRGLGSLAILLLWSLASQAGGISHIVVFGDSLSDNGNMLAQTGGLFPTTPIYWNGRMTNGMVWNETLAIDIGAALTNFAVVGAQSGTSNVWDGQLPGSPFGGLQNQIAAYTSGTVDPTAVHFIAAGSNNFLSIPSDPAAAITQGVTDITTAVATLKANGAAHVRVLNLPDLGLTPRLISAGLTTAGTGLSNAFNAALAGSLASAGFAGVPIFDTAAVMREIVANPAGFGFTNVTDACIDPFDPAAPGSCITDWTLDADEFMFWDDVHPTRAVHGVLADQIRASLMPIPASAWLFVSALLLLGRVRQRAA